MIQKARVHVAGQDNKGNDKHLPAILLTEVMDRCLDWLCPEPENRGQSGPVAGTNVSRQQQVKHLV